MTAPLRVTRNYTAIVCLDNARWAEPGRKCTSLAPDVGQRALFCLDRLDPQNCDLLITSTLLCKVSMSTVHRERVSFTLREDWGLPQIYNKDKTSDQVRYRMTQLPAPRHADATDATPATDAPRTSRAPDARAPWSR
ncbi:hypothetical protein J6590_013241 [Homalodisca vitripennis]|nr:hypothetical protein J6590_013241 [Homalodisca vitripennis]